MTESDTAVRVQVLGSGGPMHGGGRGNSAYLVWRGSRALLAVDMGGDTPTALARAGVSPGQISCLAISHVHPDHVSGLPDFIWGEINAGRSAPLTVLGPPSAPDFHDAETLFGKLFSRDGAFPDLAGITTGEPFAVNFTNASDGNGRLDLDGHGFRLRTMAVNHGDIPALAVRVDLEGVSIVFAGDQTMDDPAFIDFSRGADLMVAHAIAKDTIAGTPLGRSVPTPRAIGRAAREAGVRQLVLSHWLEAPEDAPDAGFWSLPDQAGVVATVEAEFRGAVSAARDMESFHVRWEA